MMRLRLNRPFCLSLLAIASLLALSYFPLNKTKAASVGATILPGSNGGKPLVNLKNAQGPKLTYTGAADAVAALQQGTANPTALAAADFDADGAMDVVAGYSTKNGGILALLRGNPDAFAPTDTTLYQKAMQGNVPPTFLSKVAVFTLPESPDMIVTGDFNRDGYKDVLVAARGGALYLLPGDGKGNFAAPQIVALADQVMALAAAPEGHVAVSTDGRSGPQVTILAPNTGGLAAGQTFSLPSRGTSIAWGNLGGGADVTVAAGSNVVMIYAALGANAQTETVSVPFAVQALTLGDFIWDRDARTEIAVLAEDGTVHILQHGTLDTRPLTAADVPGRRAAMMAAMKKMARSQQPPNPTALGAWTVAKQLPYSGSATSGPVSSAAFSSPHLAASPTHDLMVLDAGRSQLNILDTSGTAASPSAGLSFSGTPIAALALPQKINAARDVVVLTSGQAAPLVVHADVTLTFNVTTTADGDDAGACSTGSLVTSGTGPDGTLSLREAVCEANNNGAATSTINVPSGTYQLTVSTFGGKNSAFSSVELQVGIQSGNNITISGAGAGTTIIEQTDGIDRVIEGDELLAGNMPLAISNVTLTGGNCTTGLDCADNGGGAILAGYTGDPLTITNVVMSNNGANPTATMTNTQQGGAVTFLGPNLTISNSTFSSNAASGAGGAIHFSDGFFNGGYLAGNVSITNSAFTGNTAQISGGAIDFFDIYGGNEATISGSTFTGNKVTSGTGEGGAITAETFETGNGDGTFTMSTSRIVGNSAPAGGTGVYVVYTNDTLTNNWWGCNGGPGASGCDTVSVDPNGGSATFNPWLVLSISASPNQILPGGTSNLTIDLDHNSNGQSIGLLPEAVAIPVSYGGTLGTTIGNAALVNGLANGLYTAGATAGHGTATATVDNATATAPIEILDAVNFNTIPDGLSYTVDSTTYTTPQTFNWVVGSSHSASTTSPQAGPAGSQYVFSSWSDSGSQSHSVTAPTATTTYTASFNTQYQLTTAANPTAGGTVSPASGNFYNSGTAVPLTATANAGYNFVNWTGNVANSNNASTTVTMTAPQSVTANFSLIIVAAPTTTSVSSNNNPSFTSAPGNSVAFTATVTSNTTVNEGTVTFSDTTNNFTCSGGNTVPVSNGQAACTTTFTTEGANNITAAYNGTVNFQPSSGNFTQYVNNHTVVTGNQFCNPGAITIPGTAGAASPYPSNIFVAGLEWQCLSRNRQTEQHQLQRHRADGSAVGRSHRRSNRALRQRGRRLHHRRCEYHAR